MHLKITINVILLNLQLQKIYILIQKETHNNFKYKDI